MYTKGTLPMGNMCEYHDVMKKMFNKDKVKQDFDDVIKKILALDIVQEVLKQRKFIEINLNEVGIVNYEVKHHTKDENLKCLVLQLSLDDENSYKLISKTNNQNVILSKKEISNDYINYTNAIYAIISYFNNNGNFNNIISLIKESL